MGETINQSSDIPSLSISWLIVLSISCNEWRWSLSNSTNVLSWSYNIKKRSQSLFLSSLFDSITVEMNQGISVSSWWLIVWPTSSNEWNWSLSTSTNECSWGYNIEPRSRSISSFPFVTTKCFREYPKAIYEQDDIDARWWGNESHTGFFLEVSLSLFFVIACFIGRNLDSDDFLYLDLGFQSYDCDERVRLVMALPSTPKRRATAARVTFNGSISFTNSWQWICETDYQGFSAHTLNTISNYL